MRRILFIALLLCAGTVRGQIPTTDLLLNVNTGLNHASVMAQWTANAKSWAAQAKSWSAQFQQMQEQYAPISGVRNLGNVFNDRILRRTVPDEWTSVYDTAGDALMIGEQAARIAEMRSLTAKVHASESLGDTVDSALARVEKRSRDMAAVNKSLGQAAYSKQPALLGQIESLMVQVNATNDAKGIAEVQARIGAEAAAQAWQTNNVLLIGQLQQSERDLAREQRMALSRKILDSKNTAMPSFE